MTTVRNYTDMEFHGRVNFAKQYTDFPSDAQANDVALINGVLWVYSIIGGLLTWFPLNNQKNTYVHTQGVASLSWNVQHNLGSQDFVLGLYDSSNQPMSPASLTIVDDNSFLINFTEATLGRAVAIFQTELFAPSVTTQNVIADTGTFGGGAVVASATGLQVNGNDVLTTNSQGQADFGTL